MGMRLYGWLGMGPHVWDILDERTGSFIYVREFRILEIPFGKGGRISSCMVRSRSLARSLTRLLRQNFLSIIHVKWMGVVELP